MFGCFGLGIEEQQQWFKVHRSINYAVVWLLFLSLGIEEQQHLLKSIDLFINYAVVWLLVFSLGIEEQQQELKSLDLSINYAVFIWKLPCTDVCLF